LNLLHYKEYTDEELMLLYQKNSDVKIFDELVIRYKERIINFVYKYTNNISDAEDLTQDSFIKLYRYRDKYRDVAKFSTWFYTIVINTVRNKYNKEKNYTSIDIENVNEYELQTDDFIFEPDENGSDDDHLRRMDCVKRSFDELDDIFKEVILLRYNEEFEYDKIAELLNIPEGTVKSRINRGREHMKNIFVKLYKE